METCDLWKPLHHTSKSLRSLIMTQIFPVLLYLAQTSPPMKQILSFVSLERFVRAFYFLYNGPLFSALCWYQLSRQITAASDFKTS